MDEFYKDFRQNLENRPEPAFEAADWQAMEQLLEDKPSSNRVIPLWWFLLPFLLLSIGGNVFLYQKMNPTGMEVKEVLNTQIDTLTQTNTIYQTDTIYKDRIVYLNRKTSESKASTLSQNFHSQGAFWGWNPSQSFPLFSSSNSTGNNTWQRSSIATTPYSQLRHSFDIKTNSAILSQNLIENATSKKTTLGQKQLLTTLATNWKLLEYDSLTEIYSTVKIQAIAKRRKSLAQTLYPMRPKGLSLGLAGGVSTLLHQGVSSKGGGMGSLNIQVPFSDNLRLWGDFSIYQLSYETTQVGDDTGIPAVDSPADNFAFKYAKVKQNSLQWAVGLQYVLPVGKQWHPVVGLAYAAYQIRPYEVYHEFENTATDMEIEVEDYVTQSTLLNNRLLTEVGIERAFGKRWHWQTVVQYRFAPSEQMTILEPVLGLRTGIWFSF